MKCFCCKFQPSDLYFLWDMEKSQLEHDGSQLVVATAPITSLRAVETQTQAQTTAQKKWMWCFYVVFFSADSCPSDCHCRGWMKQMSSNSDSSVRLTQLSLWIWLQPQLSCGCSEYDWNIVCNRTVKTWFICVCAS